MAEGMAFYMNTLILWDTLAPLFNIRVKDGVVAQKPQMQSSHLDHLHISSQT